MTDTFPALAGLGWSMHKSPQWSTRSVRHVSGREVRAALYSQPLWQFELTYEVLTDNGVTDDLRTLMGFYLRQQGAFGTFFFVDPTDSQASGQALGVGDGVTTAFACVRNLGGWIEPVGAVIGNPVVSVGGVVQTGGWQLVDNRIVTFTTPPAAGLLVSADFAFAYRCRFSDDTQDYENFMYRLWSLQSCKLMSVKP